MKGMNRLHGVKVCHCKPVVTVAIFVAVDIPLLFLLLSLWGDPVRLKRRENSVTNSSSSLSFFCWLILVLFFFSLETTHYMDTRTHYNECYTAPWGPPRPLNRVLHTVILPGRDLPLRVHQTAEELLEFRCLLSSEDLLGYRHFVWRVHFREGRLDWSLEYFFYGQYFFLMVHETDKELCLLQYRLLVWPVLPCEDWRV